MQLLRFAVSFVAFTDYGAEAASPNGLSWKPHSEEDMSNLINGLANEVDYSYALESPQPQASPVVRKQGALLKKASRSVAKPRHHASIPPPVNRLNSYLGGEMGGSEVGNTLEFSTRWKPSSKAQTPPAAKPVESNIYIRDLETGHMDAPETPAERKVVTRKPIVPAPTVPVSGPLREAQKLADELDDSATTAPTLTVWEGKRASSSHSASLAHTNTYLDSVGMTVDDDSMVESSDSSAQKLKVSNPYLKALDNQQEVVKNQVQEALRRPNPRPQATSSNPYLSSIVSDRDFVVLTGA